jgi:hypothetical protein
VTEKTSIEKLPFGEYKFTASAPHYFPEERTFKVEKPGVVPFDTVNLRPMPVILNIVTKGPDVTFVLDVTTPHPGFEPLHDDRRLPDAGQKREYANVPAGNLTLIARRAGFRDHSITQALAPDSTVTLEIPVLQEITGTIGVTAPPGFQISVLSSTGESLANAQSGDQGFSGRVRIGQVTVVATKPGYVEHRETVTVAEEGAANVVVKAVVATVPVTFEGLPGVEVKVEVQQAGSWNEDPKFGSLFLNDAGASRSCAMVPGAYRARYPEIKGSVPVEFTVPVGGAPMRVTVK